jgi:hypothetical protein
MPKVKLEEEPEIRTPIRQVQDEADRARDAVETTAEVLRAF